MFAVRVEDLDVGVARIADGVIDTGGVKVCVVERSVYEDGAGVYSGENVLKVEGHGGGSLVGHFGHVAAVGPALEIAAVVFGETGEAATGDDGLDSFVEGGEEEGIVTAEGVAASGDVFFVDVGEGSEEGDGTHVVDDAFHGGAGVAMGVGVVLVFAEVGIVGGKSEVAAKGEFPGVVEIGFAAETGGFVFADFGCLVETDDGWEFAAVGIGREEEPGGDFVIDGNVAAEEAGVSSF